MPVQGPRCNHTVTTLAYVNCDRTFEMDLMASPGLRSVGTLRRSVAVCSAQQLPAVSGHSFNRFLIVPTVSLPIFIVRQTSSVILRLRLKNPPSFVYQRITSAVKLHLLSRPLCQSTNRYIWTVTNSHHLQYAEDYFLAQDLAV
jgi:hypothetical protein